MGFPENLKQARLRNRKKQKEVAEFLKVTPSTYCGYESGKRTPDLTKVHKLATFLGVRIEDLLGLETFDSGAEFDAAWKSITQSTTDPGTEVRYGADGTRTIIDRRKEKLDGIYNQLDSPDQLQLIKYGEFLLSDPKYKEEPLQD